MAFSVFVIERKTVQKTVISIQIKNRSEKVDLFLIEC